VIDRVPVHEVEAGSYLGREIPGATFTVRDGPGDTLVVDVPAAATGRGDYGEGASLAERGRAVRESERAVRRARDGLDRELARMDADRAREAWQRDVIDIVQESFETGLGSYDWVTPLYEEDGWHVSGRIRMRNDGSAVVTMRSSYSIAERTRHWAKRRELERHAGFDGLFLHAYDSAVGAGDAIIHTTDADVEHGLKRWRDGSWNEGVVASAKDLWRAINSSCGNSMIGCLITPPLDVIGIVLSVGSLILAEPTYELFRGARWLDRQARNGLGKLADAGGGAIHKVGGLLGL